MMLPPGRAGFGVVLIFEPDVWRFQIMFGTWTWLKHGRRQTHGTK